MVLASDDEMNKFVGAVGWNGVLDRAGVRRRLPSIVRKYFPLLSDQSSGVLEGRGAIPHVRAEVVGYFESVLLFIRAVFILYIAWNIDDSMD